MKAEVSRLKAGDVTSLFQFIGIPVPASLNESKQFLDYVTSSYEKLISALSNYRAGKDLRKQLVLVESKKDEHAAAFIVGNDPHKRIFLTGIFKQMNVVSNLSTMIHELSHQVLTTQDKFYYPGLDLEHDMPADRAAGHMRFRVEQALIKNRDLRERHRPEEHGGRSFRAWLTTVADFWSGYMVSQITPERAEVLHNLPSERIKQKAGSSKSR
jgi:insecticidal toxin complex protein TccC